MISRSDFIIIGSYLTKKLEQMISPFQNIIWELKQTSNVNPATAWSTAKKYHLILIYPEVSIVPTQET